MKGVSFALVKGFLGRVWGWFLPSSLIPFLTPYWLLLLFGDEVEAVMGQPLSRP